MRPPSGESAREQGRDLHERPRAVAEAALHPETKPSRHLTSSELGLVTATARSTGLVSAFATGAASGAAVLAANRFSPRFRSSIGISGKVGCAAVPFIGAFALSSHLSIARATANPQLYMSASSGGSRAAAPPVTHLAGWQRASNFTYENPMKTIIGIVTPLYGLIFYRESTHPSTRHMLLSQRLIHTRVYGQAIAISAVVAVMGFNETMKDQGPYRVDPPAVAARQAAVGGAAAAAAEGLTVAQMVAGQTAAERYARVEAPEEKTLSKDLLVPMLYFPFLFLSIYGLRNRVQKETLHKFVLGTVGVGLSHAGYIMFSDSSVYGA